MACIVPVFLSAGFGLPADRVLLVEVELRSPYTPLAKRKGNISVKNIINKILSWNDTNCITRFVITADFKLIHTFIHSFSHCTCSLHRRFLPFLFCFSTGISQFFTLKQGFCFLLFQKKCINKTNIQTKANVISLLVIYFVFLKFIAQNWFYLGSGCHGTVSCHP